MGTYQNTIIPRQDELCTIDLYDDRLIRSTTAASNLRAASGRYVGVEDPAVELIGGADIFDVLIFTDGSLGLVISASRSEASGSIELSYLCRDRIGRVNAFRESEERIWQRGVSEVLMEDPDFISRQADKRDFFLRRNYARDNLQRFIADDPEYADAVNARLANNIQVLIDSYLGEDSPHIEYRAACLLLDSDSGRVDELRNLPATIEADSSKANWEVNLTSHIRPQSDYICRLTDRPSTVSPYAVAVISFSIGAANVLRGVMDHKDSERHLLGESSQYRLDLPSRRTKLRDQAFYEGRLKQFIDVRLQHRIRSPLIEVHELNSMESSRGPIISFNLMPPIRDPRFKRLQKLIGESGEHLLLGSDRSQLRDLQPKGLFGRAVNGGENLRSLLVDLASTVGTSSSAEWSSQYNDLRATVSFPRGKEAPATIQVLGSPQTREAFRQFRALFFDTPWELESIVDVW